MLTGCENIFTWKTLKFKFGLLQTSRCISLNSERCGGMGVTDAVRQTPFFSQKIWSLLNIPLKPHVPHTKLNFRCSWWLYWMHSKQHEVPSASRSISLASSGFWVCVYMKSVVCWAEKKTRIPTTCLFEHIRTQKNRLYQRRLKENMTYSKKEKRKIFNQSIALTQLNFWDTDLVS